MAKICDNPGKLLALANQGTDAMAERKNEDQPNPKGQPQGKGQGETPTYTAGGGAKQNQGPPQGPPKQESQKSQIAQYFKSQGKQPDDVVWEMQGLQLRLRDLEGQ